MSFFSTLKQLGANILNSGVDSYTDEYLGRVTRFVNLFALITLLGLLATITNIFILNGDYPYAPAVFLFTCSVLAILLNAFRQYRIALYLYIVALNATLFYLNEYYNESTGVALFYFPLVLCMALLHNPTRGIKPTVSYFLISLVFISLSLFTEMTWLQNPGISGTNNAMLLRYNLCMSIVLSAVLVLMVINLIDRQNLRLMLAVEQEKINQAHISQALREKEVMLSEIHHRVKNNMSVISSMLNLQMNSTENAETRRLLADSRNRVMSMALVHQKLYKRNDFTRIDFDIYLSELARELINASPFKHEMELKEKLEPCELDISKAVPVGLLMNEIITNSIKHAFKQPGIRPVIEIILHRLDNTLVVTVRDNGAGFNRVKIVKEGSLGLTLIDTLTEQVDGTLLYENMGGAAYTLTIPVSEKSMYPPKVTGVE